MRVSLLGVICFLFCNGVALGIELLIESAPETLASAPERDAYIEAVQKIHGLNVVEATEVYFARVAEAAKEPLILQKLTREWADLLHVQVSGELPEVAALSKAHDLELSEAQLVFLVQQTSKQPGKLNEVNALLLKYTKELTDRELEKNKED